MVLNTLSCALLVLHRCAANFFTLLCRPSQLTYLDTASLLRTLQFRDQKQTLLPLTQGSEPEDDYSPLCSRSQKESPQGGPCPQRGHRKEMDPRDLGVLLETFRGHCKEPPEAQWSETTPSSTFKDQVL